MKAVGLIQSNYIPWKGYFDIIHDVDLFVFHDDLQYTKGDWRNRNRIKTPAGERWLTIPVGADQRRLICEVSLPATSWAKDHWRRLQAAYRETPYFSYYRAYFEAMYLGHNWRNLSQMNQAMVAGISRDLLGLTTEFADSSQFGLTSAKAERVIELLERAGAQRYVSGPAARAYLTDGQFAAAGIEVVWKDYGGYPEYPQLHGAFRHDVTVLDLLFHTGPRAPWHIWEWRSAGGRSWAAA